MASFVRRCVVSLATLAVATAPALGQSSRYVRVGLGSAVLHAPSAQFPAPGNVGSPSLAVGYVSARGHGVELRASRLNVETMQYVYPHPTTGSGGLPSICCGGEAPVTIGLQATPIELGYFYQRRFYDGALRPRVGVGAIAARVVDRWRSDTPTESARAWELGASAAAGVAVRLVGAVSVVAEGGYQHFSDSADRPARHVGLSGYRFGAGLELGF